MRTPSWFLAAVTLFFALGGVAPAGPYTDDLSKCVVESTTPQDRIDLVKWMFFAISRHPAVETATAISDEQLDEANKTVAELMTRLLTGSCREQTTKALKYEGEQAIESSFRTFGELAGRELFASPDVSAATAGMSQYLDLDALKALTEEQ